MKLSLPNSCLYLNFRSLCTKNLEWSPHDPWKLGLLSWMYPWTWLAPNLTHKFSWFTLRVKLITVLIPERSFFYVLHLNAMCFIFIRWKHRASSRMIYWDAAENACSTHIRAHIERAHLVWTAFPMNQDLKVQKLH